MPVAFFPLLEARIRWALEDERRNLWEVDPAVLCVEVLQSDGSKLWTPIAEAKLHASTVIYSSKRNMDT